jgi:hypothetical protein
MPFATIAYTWLGDKDWQVVSSCGCEGWYREQDTPYLWALVTDWPCTDHA